MGGFRDLENFAVIGGRTQSLFLAGTIHISTYKSDGHVISRF